MSELRVDVLHHQCYRFTFDAFFHVSFNNRVVSDNVILKTFGFQYLLPPLFFAGSAIMRAFWQTLQKGFLG